MLKFPILAKTIKFKNYMFISISFFYEKFGTTSVIFFAMHYAETNLLLFFIVMVNEPGEVGLTFLAKRKTDLLRLPLVAIILDKVSFLFVSMTIDHCETFLLFINKA